MPDDTYQAISVAAQDADLTARTSACAAREGIEQPDQWAWARRWELAGSPGWGAAYASAVAAGNERPGWDPAVITDGMILSGVQALGNPA